MTDDTLRSVRLTRLGKGSYEARNAAGVAIRVGGEDAFSAVELLLAAIAGCSASDVDHITGKRAEPARFAVGIEGHKIRDDQGNRMTDLLLTFDIGFDDDEGGRAAAEVLPRAVRQSHDRLCTVSRTVEVATPIEVRIEGAGA
jgi:uncharacterized OsmC-like protein